MRRCGGNRKRGARNQTGSPDRARPRDPSSPYGQKSSGGRPEPLPAATGGYGRELLELLSGIGTPKPAPLKPDPFQLQALTSLEFEDVLVTAPTGSGKTWIAREEIRRLLEAGKRAWYTTPLKALSGAKYAEFSEKVWAERVGSLHGHPETT